VGVRHFPYRTRQAINDFRQLIQCIRIERKREYDVLYFDRINIPIAAFFSFFLRRKVVVRYLGVGGMLSEMRSVRNILLSPFRWASAFTPFDYIICTKDGSPAVEYFRKYKNCKTPAEILLNGCNINVGKASAVRAQLGIPTDRVVFLFVGRLERDKGIGIFIRALSVLRRINAAFTAIVVGTGSKLEWVQKKVVEEKLEANVYVLGAVGHAEMPAYYAASDICVSLNSYGNLSNTVLEALSAGRAIITLSKDERSGRDADTKNVLGEAALYVERDNAEKELSNVLLTLIKNPEQIALMRKAANERAARYVVTWENRIKKEIEILRQVAGRPR
jgi:glycosyltransferase involved in cell wall biosynthesis